MISIQERLRKTSAIVLIGNGSSINLIDHLNLSDSIKYHQPLPCDLNVKFIPLEDDKAHGEHRVTQLWQHWHFPALDQFKSLVSDGNPSLQDVSLELLRQHRSTGRYNDEVFFSDSGSATLNWHSPRFQLRCYLWRWAYYYESILFDRLKNDQTTHTTWLRWPWSFSLEQLVNDPHTTFASYNYDCNLENVLRRFRPVSVVTEDWPNIRAIDPDTAIVLKPHGTLANLCKLAVPHRPWASNFLISGMRFTGQKYRYEYLPKRSPGIPDIVPPGHNHLFSVSDQANAFQAMHEAARSTTLFVTLGFAASPPDDEALRQVATCLPDGATTVQVDINQENEASRILQSSRFDYRFVNAAQDPWLEGLRTAWLEHKKLR